MPTMRSVSACGSWPTRSKAWDQSTGALGRLDIDPLPHQIHVAHQGSQLGDVNWLIADDVGLGKTIEVGLILHALAQRNRVGASSSSARRVSSGNGRTRCASSSASCSRFTDVTSSSTTPRTGGCTRRQSSRSTSPSARRTGRCSGAGGMGRRHLRRGAPAGPKRVRGPDRALSAGRGAPTAHAFAAAPHCHPASGQDDTLCGTVGAGPARPARRAADPRGQSRDRRPGRRAQSQGARHRAAGNLIFRGHDTHRVRVEPSDRAASLRPGAAALPAPRLRRERAIGHTRARHRLRHDDLPQARLVEHRCDRARVGAAPGAAARTSDRAVRSAPSSIEALIEAGALDGDELAEQRSCSGGRVLRDEARRSSGCSTSPGRPGLRREAGAVHRRGGRPLLARGDSLLVFTEYRATQRYLAERLTAMLPAPGEPR